ncbi:MAG: hypothetical protein RL277_2215 [Planctomycetota bacterium]|jgi:peptide/nickel transport system substrate-binding protein
MRPSYRLHLLVLALSLLAACGDTQSPQQQHPQQQHSPAPPPQAAAPFVPASASASVSGAGGRATIHLESLPRGLNYALEGSGVLRRILYELHETLLLENWDTGALEPNLCRSFRVTDCVVTQDGTRHYGDQQELRARLGSAVASVLPGTGLVFELRDDVLWHDGERFDSSDVVFSASIWRNPLVECGERRAQYQKLIEVRAEGPWRVVAGYAEPYFRAAHSFGDLPLLPAHLYDLNDPDLPRFHPETRAGKAPDWQPDEAERAAWINKNPHNRAFVGLGPYRLVSFEGDRIRSRRFERYFAPERGGRLDELDWLFVREDRMAIEALKNGELDVFARLSTEDWFGETTASAAFTERAVKRHAPSGAYWFIAWNLRLPKLSDVRVRTALAQAFDFEAFRQSAYRGLAMQVTGHGVPGLKGYDDALAPLPHDPAAARRLLAEAGWIDRDGDRVLDKDGERFTLGLLSNAGNAINQLVVAALQNDLAQVGIEVRGELIEFATMRERALNREFEGYVSAWALASESDPEKQFHSRSAAQARSPNFPGFSDPESDRLIEAAQLELDPARRAELWKSLQRRVYAQQPYLFGFTAPRKFAFARNLSGVELVRGDPNYVARRWHRTAGGAQPR